MLFLVDSLIGTLTRIGANITGSQLAILKWRLSDDGKKYYTEEETLKFYKAIESGNTDILDVTRKEKQKIINNLKRNALMSFVGFILLSLQTSCFSIPKNINRPPINSDFLQESDKTYALKEDQQVKLKDTLNPVDLHGNWFVVNEDFIKTYNENQDTLIATLKKTEEIKNTNKYYLYLYIASIVGLLALFIWKRK